MGDVDRKTFYLHYDTIYDVVTEMEQEVAGEVRQLLAQKKDITISEIFCGLNELMENEFLVYAEYCASGIIGIYTDWLAGNNPLSLEELVEIASDAVECGWQKIQG
jgi:hypothetical protein